MPVLISHIVDALSSLGGEAHIDQIVSRVREIAPEPWPADVAASVRARIQERCSEAGSFKGGDDLFESVHGVLLRRGVWRLKFDALSPGNPDLVQDGADAFLEASEGRAMLRIHLRRERSRKLITEFKQGLHDLACEACGFDFGKAYGSLGAGYIEAHHILPISKLNETSTTRISDLVALCANCHRVIHRNDLLTVEQLRASLQRGLDKGV